MTHSTIAMFVSASTFAAAGLLAQASAASADATAQLTVTSADSSTRWEPCTTDGCSQPIQLVDVIVNNTGSSVWITKDDMLTIEIQSPSLDTVQKATVKRLMPGDAAIVEIGVQSKSGVTAGSTGPATAVASWADGQTASLNYTAMYGIPQYQESAASVNTHQSPDWFRKAKYGIFIHWGVYAVPAYGSVSPNESYAEWYWNHLENPGEPTDTYDYHKQTYGEDVVYDDFIQNFTAENFVPKDWVDLIADAGARYFVPTSKHHEGFALFDMPSNVSERNSVRQTPHRDLLKELFEAAEQYQPDLVRGTYFSLPEWYNPAYTPYGDNVTFGVGPPKNSYTNETVPYTGYVEVDDFLTGIQFPQMEILAYNYNTSIMWCDIGRASLADEFLGKWLNYAQQQDQQVTFNSRCGDAPSGSIAGDYQTPEYESVSAFTAQHWEACRGLDPFSFGYNKFTPDDQYLNASGIVQTVVDIVAKNGNLLLDIGPKADGTIPDIMATNLRGAGKWFKSHDQSVFDTKYWPYSQGDGDFRFTTTDDAFYIHSLSEPASSITIPVKVPFMQCDKVTVVGGSQDGTEVPASTNDQGLLTLTISDAVASGDQYAWTFKIEY